MTSDILLRVLISVAIIGVGLGVYWLVNRLTLLRAPTTLLENVVSPGKSVLVYFTTPTCVPCKTVQRPAIGQIQAVLGEALQVIEIDATQQPDMAQRWGVMSVPTTFVIDSRGQARFVNHGVARADKLFKQLQAL